MTLKNESLRKIKITLEPVPVLSTQSTVQVKDEVLPQTGSPQIVKTPSMTSVATPLATYNSEFIPHLFFALHQIRKDPNNSSNQLETTTGSIKRRLKNCKSFIESSEECKTLLSKSTDEWSEHIAQRQLELETKKHVLNSLEEKIKTILENKNQV